MPTYKLKLNTFQDFQYELMLTLGAGYWARGVGDAEDQIARTYFNHPAAAEEHAVRELQGLYEAINGAD